MRAPEASPATCFSAAGVRARGIRVYIIVVLGGPCKTQEEGRREEVAWQAALEPMLQQEQFFYIFCLLAKIYEIWVMDMMARGTPG